MGACYYVEYVLSGGVSLSLDNDFRAASIYLNSGCVNKALPQLLQGEFKK